MRLALVEGAKEHDRFIKSLSQHPFNLYSSVMVLCALYVYVKWNLCNECMWVDRWKRVKRSAFVNLLHIRNASHILHTFVHTKRGNTSTKHIFPNNLWDSQIFPTMSSMKSRMQYCIYLRFVINKIVIKQPQGASNASNAYNSPNIQTIFTISTEFIQLYHTLFAFPFENLLRTFIYGSTLNLHNSKIFLEFFQREFEMSTNGEKNAKGKCMAWALHKMYAEYRCWGMLWLPSICVGIFHMGINVRKFKQ